MNEPQHRMGRTSAPPCRPAAWHFSLANVGQGKDIPTILSIKRAARAGGYTPISKPVMTQRMNSYQPHNGGCTPAPSLQCSERAVSLPNSKHWRPQRISEYASPRLQKILQSRFNHPLQKERFQDRIPSFKAGRFQKLPSGPRDSAFPLEANLLLLCGRIWKHCHFFKRLYSFEPCNRRGGAVFDLNCKSIQAFHRGLGRLDG